MQDKRRHRSRIRLLYLLLAATLAVAATGSIALHLLRDRFQTFPTSSF